MKNQAKLMAFGLLLEHSFREKFGVAIVIKNSCISNIHNIQQCTAGVVPYLALDILHDIIVHEQYARFDEALKMANDIHHHIASISPSLQHDTVYFKLVVGLKIKAVMERIRVHDPSSYPRILQYFETNEQFSEYPDLNDRVVTAHATSLQATVRLLACPYKCTKYFKKQYDKMYGPKFMDKLQQLALDLFSDYKAVAKPSLLSQIANNLPATSCKHKSLQLIADAAKMHNTFTEDVVFDVFEKICNTTDDLRPCSEKAADKVHQLEDRKRNADTLGQIDNSNEHVKEQTQDVNKDKLECEARVILEKVELNKSIVESYIEEKSDEPKRKKSKKSKKAKKKKKNHPDVPEDTLINNRTIDQKTKEKKNPPDALEDTQMNNGTIDQKGKEKNIDKHNKNKSRKKKHQNDEERMDFAKSVLVPKDILQESVEESAEIHIQKSSRADNSRLCENIVKPKSYVVQNVEMVINKTISNSNQDGTSGKDQEGLDDEASTSKNRDCKEKDSSDETRINMTPEKRISRNISSPLFNLNSDEQEEFNAVIGLIPRHMMNDSGTNDSLPDVVQNASHVQTSGEVRSFWTPTKFQTSIVEHVRLSQRPSSLSAEVDDNVSFVSDSEIGDTTPFSRTDSNALFTSPLPPSFVTPRKRPRVSVTDSECEDIVVSSRKASKSNTPVDFENPDSPVYESSPYDFEKSANHVKPFKIRFDRFGSPTVVYQCRTPEKDSSRRPLPCSVIAKELKNLTSEASLNPLQKTPKSPNDGVRKKHCRDAVSMRMLMNQRAKANSKDATEPADISSDVKYQCFVKLVRCDSICKNNNSDGDEVSSDLETDEDGYKSDNKDSESDHGSPSQYDTCHSNWQNSPANTPNPGHQRRRTDR